MTEHTEQLKKLVVECLKEKKATNLLVIDLKGKNKLVEYIILADGSSTKNVAAIAEYVALQLKHSGVNSNIEGLGKSEWVLIDAGSILVNVFHPETRAYFNLEEIWIKK